MKKRLAPANLVRVASAAILLAFTLSAPPAHAQFSQGESAATPRSAVDRNFLIGTWSDAGDCATNVAFTADGGYATADGLQGQWSLAGDRLTLHGEAGSATLTIIPIDRNTMEVIGEDGSHDRSTRCAGRVGDVEVENLRVACGGASFTKTAEPGRPLGRGRPVRSSGLAPSRGKRRPERSGQDPASKVVPLFLALPTERFLLFTVILVSSLFVD